MNERVVIERVQNGYVVERYTDYNQLYSKSVFPELKAVVYELSKYFGEEIDKTGKQDLATMTFKISMEKVDE